jgi:hypothetical protein
VDVANALRFWKSAIDWSDRVRSYLTGPFFQVHRPNLAPASQTNGLFVPVLPLLQAISERATNARSEASTSTESTTSTDASATADVNRRDSIGSGAVPIGLINSFLSQHINTLNDKRAVLLTTYASTNAPGLFTFDEAWIVQLSAHFAQV